MFYDIVLLNMNLASSKISALRFWPAAASNLRRKAKCLRDMQNSCRDRAVNRNF